MDEHNQENPIRDNVTDDLVKQQQGQRRRNIIIIVIILGVLLAAGAFAYWKYGGQNYNYTNNYNGPLVVNDGSQSPGDNILQPGDPGYSTSTDPSPQPTYTPDVYENQQCENRLAPVVSKSGSVEWVEPKKLANLHIFGSTSATAGDYGYYQDFSYVVGHVKSGKYQGGDFIVTQAVPDGPSAGDRYRLIYKDGTYYYLSKYSDALPDPQWGVKFTTALIKDETFDLPDLDFPEKFHEDSLKADFSYAKNTGFYKNGLDFFCADDLVKAFTDPVLGDVYTDKEIPPVEGQYSFGGMHGFYIKGGDSSKRSYQLDIPIISEQNVPLLTWSDGKKNTEEYSFQALGGCGAGNFRDIAAVKESDLTKIGTSIDGQAVYNYKNKNAQELKDLYDSTYFPEGQGKPSYDAFVASHPVFFWKDPFGKFIRFKNKKYQPMAECAKPVIYLYPTKTQRISVAVNPLGGMLKSDPAYNHGWNVVADPQSNIIVDGKTYPYLFWEGRGGIYQTPLKGFVIMQTDVHQFLTNKLHALGLNNKESVDFMEFWEPKMQNAPYYFVTFMGNAVMDEVAPLTISPKPDTIIRVLMDFTPLEKPIMAQGYNIRTPERKGFTVVEWGGVLK